MPPKGLCKVFFLLVISQDVFKHLVAISVNKQLFKYYLTFLQRQLNLIIFQINFQYLILRYFNIYF